MSLDLTQALIDFLRRWGELRPSSAAVLAAVFVITVPQIALYAYLGAIGRTALLGEGEGLNLGIMAAGGVTFLVVVLLITRRVRASMRELEARRAIQPFSP